MLFRITMIRELDKNQVGTPMVGRLITSRTMHALRLHIMVCPSFYYLPPSLRCNHHKVALPFHKGCEPFPFMLEEYAKEGMRGIRETHEVGEAVRFLFTLFLHPLTTHEPQE